MYKDLKAIYDRNRKDMFCMAVSHLLDIGFRTAVEITDEDIDKLEGNGLMTESFVKALVKLTREIAKATTPTELIMFSESVSLYDTANYAPNRPICWDRLCEIATTLIHHIIDDEDDDCVDYALEDAGVYLEYEEKEFFEVPICEDDDDEDEDEPEWDDEVNGWVITLDYMPYDKVFETENGNRENCHATGRLVCFEEDKHDWWNEYVDSEGKLYYGR